MKNSNQKTVLLLKRLCGLVGLYIMMCVVFGTGLILIQASDQANEIEVASINDVVELDVEVAPSLITELTRIDDIFDLKSEAYAELVEAVKPVYKEQPVRIKPGVEGLNIRQEKNVDSKVLGVMYDGEIAIAKIPYVLDELALEEWTELLNGNVRTEYIEIIEEPVDLLEYRLTPKGTYTKNPILSTDVTQKSYVSVNDLAEVTSGTPLEGIETAVVRAEENYGINGLFIYAVATLESGGGTSTIARNKNNLFGMNAQDHDPYNLAFSYDSFYESVVDFVERIEKYYVNQGLTDIYSINEKYSSDPAWDSKVFNIMTRTYNEIIN